MVETFTTRRVAIIDGDREAADRGQGDGEALDTGDRHAVQPRHVAALPTQKAVVSAATASSRLSQAAVPKSRLADMSTASQVSSSRSAIIWRTCGCVVRAVTDQSIRITFEPNLVTGEDMTQKNGCGAIHVALKEVDVPNRYNLSVQLTYPDPEIYAMLLGATTYTTGGQVVGAQAPPLGSVPTAQVNGVSFEFWTKRVGPGGQAQDYAWWHFVFPRFANS